MENKVLIEKIGKESLVLFSTLKAVAVALENIQGEANPALAAANMSYAVEYAAEVCEAHYNTLTELMNK